jgi:hypothetical protein
MDGSRFDVLTRDLSSRRTALAGLFGGTVALLRIARAEEADARSPAAACRRLDDPAKRRSCLRRARRHNRNRQSCKPQPVAVTCGGDCGTRRNNCRQVINCTCPAGKSCLGTGSCNRTCVNEPPGSIQGTCPTGCNCFTSLVEDGARHCIPATITECAQVPQVCTSTAQCPVGQFCGTTGCGPESAPENRCLPVCSI